MGTTKQDRKYGRAVTKKQADVLAEVEEQQVVAWATYDAEILEVADSTIQDGERKHVARLLPIIKNFVPGQAVQIFGRKDTKSVCKAFGIISRQQIDENKGILPNVAILLNKKMGERHECNGEDCPIEQYVTLADDVLLLNVFEIDDITICHNQHGVFFQLKLAA